MTIRSLQRTGDHQGYVRDSTSSPISGYCDPLSYQPKSRAIMIKRTCKKEKSQQEMKEEARRKEATAECDRATWRMYNRIIDYRQKNPVSYQCEDAEEADEDPAAFNIKVFEFVATRTPLEVAGTFKRGKAGNDVSFHDHSDHIDSSSSIEMDEEEIFQFDL